MITQWILEQDGQTDIWTERHPTWTLDEFFRAMPGFDSPPEGECPYEETWTATNGKTYKLCTKCVDDEEPEHCEARHLEALAYFQNKFPPQP